ncbi:IclR family transcriptional regulator [Haloactinopolyspora alba]|uniref:IclR family transcriptional regulator n=1 Tax=Haloactinopolyspora alba TaxID=648780 RepID=A0A2P8E9J8_9ACTN|nr:IclR family transcriptional regulator [Haloactinopolyspora alba]PSL06128.1 IclR family transcriptional regulator [Haloactinopolyspora alba]
MVETTGGQAVYRALDVVAHLGRHREGARLGEIADALTLPPSTVRRLLRILCERQFAVQDPVSRCYGPGPQLWRFESAQIDVRSLRDVAAPVLTELRDATTETVFLSVREGSEVIYVESVPAVHPVQMYGRPGDRVPVHATAQGKAILAHLPSSLVTQVIEQLRFPAFTAHTITSAQEFRAALDAVHARGHALSVEEHEAGVISIAAAVLDPEGRAVGAVCVGCPRFRWDPESLEAEVAEPVRRAAARITALLFPLAGATAAAEPVPQEAVDVR